MKEKIVREIDELPAKYQDKVVELFEDRVKIHGMETELKKMKEENTEEFLVIMFDELKIDSIKSGAGTVTIPDKSPTLDDSQMKEALKKHRSIEIVEKIIKCVKRTKEELLREVLKKEKFSAKEIEEVVTASLKESEPSITFRPVNNKKK